LERELPPERFEYRRIGTVHAHPGVQVTRGGTVMEFSHSGFDHFGGKT
jgi:hypothetical protein